MHAISFTSYARHVFIVRCLTICGWLQMVHTCMAVVVYDVQIHVLVLAASGTGVSACMQVGYLNRLRGIQTGKPGIVGLHYIWKSFCSVSRLFAWSRWFQEPRRQEQPHVKGRHSCVRPHAGLTAGPQLCGWTSRGHARQQWHALLSSCLRLLATMPDRPDLPNSHPHMSRWEAIIRRFDLNRACNCLMVAIVVAVTAWVQ